MRELLVSNIYNVTQISKTNNTPWEKMEAIVNEGDEDILFDFSGIELTEPWNNLAFRKLMGNPHVNIKVYSSEKVKDTIEMMCLMGNLPTGRVSNEDIIIKEPVTTKRKQVIALAKRFEDKINIAQGVGVLNICEVVDQLGSTTTVESLEMALKDFSEKSSVTAFEVDTESIFIQINIMERLATLMGTLKSMGIDLRIKSEDEDTAGYIKTYQCIAGTAQLTGREKAYIFKNNMDTGTVGMLSKFKDTKGKDAFGRKGDGKPVVCRPAIYKGIKQKDKAYYVVLREYNGSTFFTKLHYKMENDGERHPGLKYVDLEIPISEIGIGNLFVGSLYHFNLPIQYRPEDYTSTYKQDGEEDPIRIINRTLPEHIKSVFDEFGVKYNNMALIHAIGETFRYLRKCDISSESNKNNNK